MYSLMHYEMTFLFEAHITMAALEWPISSMIHLMHYKKGISIETFITMTTLEWPLLGSQPARLVEITLNQR